MGVSTAARSRCARQTAGPPSPDAAAPEQLQTLSRSRCIQPDYRATVHSPGGGGMACHVLATRVSAHSRSAGPWPGVPLLLCHPVGPHHPPRPNMLRRKLRAGNWRRDADAL